MERILDRFRTHTMGLGKQELSKDLRHVYIEFVKVVAESLPDSREKSQVITCLEEALFYTTACIARNDINVAPSLYPPHQDRVIKEKEENDKKLKALGVFITSNPIFPTLDKFEQTRLLDQRNIMDALSCKLSERIDNF